MTMLVVTASSNRSNSTSLIALSRLLGAEDRKSALFTHVGDFAGAEPVDIRGAGAPLLWRFPAKGFPELAIDVRASALVQHDL
jgi:hypothetical protein